MMIQEIADVRCLGEEIANLNRSQMVLPIAVIWLKDEKQTFTWRGAGQMLPKGALAGIAFVHVSYDKETNAYFPSRIDLDPSLYENWSKYNWEPHRMFAGWFEVYFQGN